MVRLVATAGRLEGRGHLGRQLALAEALSGSGAQVELAVVRGSLSPVELARADRAAVRSPGHVRADVVVVDLPDLSEVEAWADSGRTLAVFDDGDAYAGRADLIVQPSLPRWSGPGRAGRVLEGYDFAVLGAALRSAAPKARDGVLVCFGGSDPAGVTDRIVAETPIELVDDLSVVIGAGFERPTEGWPVAPVRDPDDLANRLAGARVALLGAGLMKFEAAFLGTPAVLVAAADDQLAVGPPFAAGGAALWLGDGRTIDPAEAWRAVNQLLRDDARLAAMGEAGRRIVDGRGAERVASAIVHLAGGRP